MNKFILLPLLVCIFIITPCLAQVDSSNTNNNSSSLKDQKVTNGAGDSTKTRDLKEAKLNTFHGEEESIERLTNDKQDEEVNVHTESKSYTQIETENAADKVSKTLKIKFRLFDAGDNVLKGANIRLYKGNSMIEEIAKSTSIVQLTLEEGNYYTLEVVLNGFLTKRIVINTDLLDAEIKREEYRFEVELERSADYDKYSDTEDVYDYPRAIIEFDTNTRLFKANEEYFLSTKKAFEKLYRSNREIKF